MAGVTRSLTPVTRPQSSAWSSAPRSSLPVAAATTEPPRRAPPPHRPRRGPLRGRGSHEAAHRRSESTRRVRSRARCTRASPGSTAAAPSGRPIDRRRHQDLGRHREDRGQGLARPARSDHGTGVEWRRDAHRQRPADGADGVFPVASSDPAYAYDRNPNSIKGYTLSVELPEPKLAASPSCVGGTIGVSVLGVPIYSAFDASSRDTGRA